MTFGTEELLSIRGLVEEADPADIRLVQYILAAGINRTNIFPSLSDDQLEHLPTERRLIADGSLSNNSHLEVNPELLEIIGPSLAIEFSSLCQEHRISVVNARDGLSLQFARLLTVLARH